MKTRSIAIGAVALLALAGCGGAAASSTPSASITPSTAMPAAAPAMAVTSGPTTTAPSAPVTPAPAAPVTPAPSAPVTPAPAPSPATTTVPLVPADAVVVTQVIDGDTIATDSGEHIRLIGIDTPERGHCGYETAATNLRTLVDGNAVVLVPGARDDVDKYGRLLRYVELTDGTDTGLAQIVDGYAIARYDSRDGYGHHDREEEYVAADTGAAAPCTVETPPVTPSSEAAYYANCPAARAAGAAPLLAGEPGYRAGLDRDGDGVACE